MDLWWLCCWKSHSMPPGCHDIWYVGVMEWCYGFVMVVLLEITLHATWIPWYMVRSRCDGVVLWICATTEVIKWDLTCEGFGFLNTLAAIIPTSHVLAPSWNYYYAEVPIHHWLILSKGIHFTDVPYVIIQLIFGVCVSLGQIRCVIFTFSTMSHVWCSM